MRSSVPSVLHITFFHTSTKPNFYIFIASVKYPANRKNKCINFWWEDGVTEDARKLGERNWRNAARNRDSWQKLLKKAWPKRDCCANDDDDDDDKLLDTEESNELPVMHETNPGYQVLHLPSFSRNVILSLFTLITSDPKHDAVTVIGRFSSTKLTAKEKLPSPTSNTVSPATNVSGCILFN